jgi:hypothetical protein
MAAQGADNPQAPAGAGVLALIECDFRARETADNSLQGLMNQRFLSTHARWLDARDLEDIAEARPLSLFKGNLVLERPFYRHVRIAFRFRFHIEE